MNIEKMTNKTREALIKAREIAIANSSFATESVHILSALIKDKEGLIPELLVSCGVDTSSLEKQTDDLIASMPKVAGSGYSEDSVYLSSESETVLLEASKLCGEMGDEYISVEHIFIALIRKGGRKLCEIFDRFSIKESNIKKELKNVRSEYRKSRYYVTDTRRA